MKPAIYLFFMLISAAISNSLFAQRPNLVREFKQIVPPGAIAAITNPTYVPANQAKIDKNTWVFGVSIDGQERAYSLSLLNRYEVVNDKFGDLAVAAVW
jgi:hypothetical protein